MNKLMIALALGSLTLAPLANAQSGERFPDGAHIYVGGSYGLFKSRGGDFDDDNDLLEATAGVFFNRHFGLEASYTDFGSYGGSLASADTYGYGIALVGRLPLSETWGLYAKGGQFFWKADVNTAIGDTRFDGDDLFYAAGMDVRLTTHINMIVEYSRYEIDTRASDLPGVENTDLDTLKVGVRFRF